MTNPIDLTTTQAVKGWLAANGMSLVSVDTTVPAGITPGLQTVTPASMAGITLNSQLAIDTPPNLEVVLVTAITATTFTATFVVPHAAGVTVMLAQDMLLPALVTSASLQFLRWTGRGPQDGSLPVQSPFVEPCDYDEVYDGSGTDRQFTRNAPIVSVALVEVDGLAIPASTGTNIPGWVVDGAGKSITIRPGGPASGLPYGSYGGFWGTYARNFGARYNFNPGAQNVRVQYQAGFYGIPYDVMQAVTEIVALATKDRSWIGHRSESLAAGGGTVSFGGPGDYGNTPYMYVPPRSSNVIEMYKRRALVY
jgi:hypothetical protein